MPDAYTRLAPLYDALAKGRGIAAFYGEWRRSIRAAARRHGIRPHVLVDLACGTGNSTVPWTRLRGLTVVGVDRSEAMLRVARRKSSRVRWYRQDVRRLRLHEQADLVTCHFDALNHVLRESDLRRVFAGVARVLRERGLFQFDLNTRHMLRWLGGREKLFRVGPHLFVASNAFDPTTGIATFRQIWFVRLGHLYRKVQIVVRERAFDERRLRRALRWAGLRLVRAETQRVVQGRAARRVYLAATPGALRTPTSEQPREDSPVSGRRRQRQSALRRGPARGRRGARSGPALSRRKVGMSPWPDPCGSRVAGPVRAMVESEGP